jgi:hypothetical protein
VKNFNKGKNYNKGSKFVGSNRTQDNFIIESEADYIEDEDYDERGDDYGYQDDSMAMIPGFYGSSS